MLVAFQKFTIYAVIVTALFSLAACVSETEKDDWRWQTLAAKNEPVARHEAGFTAVGDKLYLIGGRRINQTSVFDISMSTWTNLSRTPIELHHFQPVVFNEKIYIIGAMTGPWPNESPVANVIIYDPETDTYETSHPIPPHRQRGGAGAAVYNNKIYLVGGVTHGHLSGNKPWLDEYDPVTGKWKTLPDAPNARDHFQAVVADNKLYAFAGRLTRESAPAFGLTNQHGNIYDFKTARWQPITNELAIPVGTAGNAAFGWNNQVVIVGGESDVQVPAHSESQAFNITSRTWSAWPQLVQGRHGSGVAIANGHAYIASGSGNRGGGPELVSIERLKLPVNATETTASASDTVISVHQQFHTVTLNFNGPETDEMAAVNPFSDFKLTVNFTHQESGQVISIPGFYAADGNAAESSATSGNVWQVKFSPQQTGTWQYQAALYQGKDIALKIDMANASLFPLENAQGSFLVTRSDKEAPDFRAKGKLTSNAGYFLFENSGEHWLKGGANSPENFLAFGDFDGTYRVSAAEREGEAKANAELHQYANHSVDWNAGDLTWQQGKGKNIVGAINYLAAKGMNSLYFLTMNIGGDGKDVWPYVSHDNFKRFDVSKLAQWDLLFSYMQSKGILLHVVLQETENERLLDGGNTGVERQLYFNELIARFGHHNALVWNLGEENGPASWSPIAQNTQQRNAMAKHFSDADPFDHPVLIHTHAYEPTRSEIIAPLLGNTDFDGLSFQADKREQVPNLMREWRTKSKNAGQEWLITMDEIGAWHTGATTDAENPNHDSLRQYALWGAILYGAAGVEWYFGAKSPHNDLTSEDWRERENLWQQTKIAQDFFTQHSRFWNFESCNEFNEQLGFCAQDDTGATFIYYFADSDYLVPQLSSNTYQVSWLNPMQGGELVDAGTLTASDNKVLLEKPQSLSAGDWVVLLAPINE